MNNFIGRGGLKTHIGTLLSESGDAKNVKEYSMSLSEIQHTLQKVGPKGQAWTSLPETDYFFSASAAQMLARPEC